jgi:hypothetical protein
MMLFLCVDVWTITWLRDWGIGNSYFENLDMRQAVGLQ